MSPLSSLQVEQFKCFEDLRIPLKPLTLFTGFNGAGKSTALQPLLLLAQALRVGSWKSLGERGHLPLNGDVVRLGSAGDVFRIGAAERSTRFEIAAGEDVVRVLLSGKAGSRSLIAELLAEHGRANDLFDRFSRLVHISAVRTGPADSFPIPDRLHTGVVDVGADGRYASYWYHELADEPVDAARRLPKTEGSTFRRQVDAWLGFLAPGAEANVQAVPAASRMALQFRLTDIGEWKRPANVGYGLTYAFPIIVQLLAAKAGDVVTIDSPEAHLHPQAQSRMGRILATFAVSGIQLLVETHSDHVLNGTRLAVAEKTIGSSELGLLFFSGARNESHGVSIPRLDENGRIHDWPEGFFDQIDNDVALLSGWR